MSDAESATAKPPSLVIFLGGYYLAVSVLCFVIVAVKESQPKLISGLMSLALAIGVFKGWRWCYWVGAAVTALSIGVANLQLSIPGWRFNNESDALMLASMIWRAGTLILHRFQDILGWFAITPTRANRRLFWLGAGLLAFLGQLILPTMRSFGLLD